MSKLVQSLLSAALVMFAAAAPLATPAHAKFEFGATESIRKIQDVDIKGSEGEALFLGYKITRQAILLPYAMSDDGYVLGVRQNHDRYYALTPEQIAAFQNEGSLPNPMPKYEIEKLDWAIGHALWLTMPIVLLAMFWPSRKKKEPPQQTA